MLVVFAADYKTPGAGFVSSYRGLSAANWTFILPAEKGEYHVLLSCPKVSSMMGVVQLHIGTTLLLFISYP